MYSILNESFHFLSLVKIYTYYYNKKFQYNIIKLINKDITNLLSNYYKTFYN